MKKINKKRKGFTIVELVIVIAVIAILAGVLIPTFAGVIEKANQSTDIQAVRQMNTALMAESVENPPARILEVIEIVSEAGYNTEIKLTPAKKGHSFYWNKIHNIIVLVKDANGETAAELIYPREDQTVVNDFSTHINDNTIMYNLRDSFGLTLLSRSLKLGVGYTMTSDETINDSIEFPVGSTATLNLGGNTLTINNGADIEVLGELTVTNGYIISYAERISTKEAGLGASDGGKLYLNNVTITDKKSYDDGNPAVYCRKASKATITECIFNVAEDITISPAVYNGDNCSMTITSCTFNYGTLNDVCFAPIDLYDGELTLNNSTILSGTNCLRTRGTSNVIIIVGGEYTYVEFTKTFTNQYGSYEVSSGFYYHDGYYGNPEYTITNATINDVPIESYEGNSLNPDRDYNK